MFVHQTPASMFKGCQAGSKKKGHEGSVLPILPNMMSETRKALNSSLQKLGSVMEVVLARANCYRAFLETLDINTWHAM